MSDKRNPFTPDDFPLVLEHVPTQKTIGKELRSCVALNCTDCEEEFVIRILTDEEGTEFLAIVCLKCKSYNLYSMAGEAVS